MLRKLSLAVALVATTLPALAAPPAPPPLESYKLQALRDAARASHPDSRALAARLAEQLDMMILELATRVGEPPPAQADAELLQ